MKTLYQDSRSLMDEWRLNASAATPRPRDETEAEKAEALREYQKLVNQIDDVVREQEIQRRIGAR
jgi:hypothetical protein